MDDSETKSKIQNHIATKGINHKGFEGDTILHEYCNEIDSTSIEIFKYLVESGADLNILNENGVSPLQTVMTYWNAPEALPTVEYLFTQPGIDVNAQHNGNMSLLHCASLKLSQLPIEIFKSFIEKNNGDVNITDRWGNSPIYHAISVLWEDPDKEDIIFYFLSQPGVNINLRNRSGKTLLHLCGQYFPYISFKLFKTLIQVHHGDLNIEDNSGQTPLNWALKHFHPRQDCLKSLIYLLTQPNIRIGEETFLGSAAGNIENLPIEIFKLLVEIPGVGIHGKNHRRINPISRACRWYNLNINYMRYSEDKQNEIDDILRYLLLQSGVNHPTHSISLICTDLLSNPMNIIDINAVSDVNKFIARLCSPGVAIQTTQISNAEEVCQISEYDEKACRAIERLILDKIDEFN